MSIPPWVWVPLLCASLAPLLGWLVCLAALRTFRRDPEPPHSRLDCDLGRHAFEPRYDEDGPEPLTEELVKKAHALALDHAPLSENPGSRKWEPYDNEYQRLLVSMRKGAKKTYVRDVCPICGETRERAPGGASG